MPVCVPPLAVAPGPGVGVLAAAIVAGTISGFALACQPGVNGTLGKILSHKLHASLTSFTVGLACSIVACLLIARSLPKPSDYADAPWWTFTGGAIGAFLVTASLIFAPRVGAGAWLGIMIVAQLGGAVLLDHWGLAGYEVRPATWVRLLGVTLMIGGVVMVLRG
ncbi:DMT family transporter [Alienimonas sp. DA493]|uniref:DMT family transporter n=1 Tax=Alienimonas sp. DA493 TaxID=3373605 RepID=UPI003754767D